MPSPCQSGAPLAPLSPILNADPRIRALPQRAYRRYNVRVRPRDAAPAQRRAHSFPSSAWMGQGSTLHWAPASGASRMLIPIITSLPVHQPAACARHHASLTYNKLLRPCSCWLRCLVRAQIRKRGAPRGRPLQRWRSFCLRLRARDVGIVSVKGS